jgi:hypothetical protein
VIKFDIDTSALLKWARFLDQIPKKTKAAAARALNAYGDEVVRGTAQALADKTGLDVNDVGNLIVVDPATPDHLNWVMDASAVYPSNDQSRVWEGRDTNEFEKNTLLKIVPFDDQACEICQEAAENSPYTLEQIGEMQAKWEDYTPPGQLTAPGPRTNLVHPHCRCQPQPWASARRAPISSGDMSEGPPQLFSGRQLGRKFADELRMELRAK